MQVLYLAFVLLFGAVSCIRHCEIHHCFPDIDFHIFDLPDEKQLHKLCHDVIKGLECADEKILSCTGSNLRELAKSTNATVAEFAEKMISARDFFEDLCFENSRLHEAYIQSHACITEYFSSPPKRTCSTLLEATYEAYKELLNELPEEQKSSLPSPDDECLNEAYYIYCVAKDIKMECGESGRHLFESVILNTNVVHISCRKGELEDIKRKFLQSLEVTGERKDYFVQAFKAIMKKK